MNISYSFVGFRRIFTQSLLQIKQKMKFCSFSSFMILKRKNSGSHLSIFMMCLPTTMFVVLLVINHFCLGRYVGRVFVKSTGKPADIFNKLNEMASFAPDEEIELFEVSFCSCSVIHDFYFFFCFC